MVYHLHSLAGIACRSKVPVNQRGQQQCAECEDQCNPHPPPPPAAKPCLSSSPATESCATGTFQTEVLLQDLYLTPATVESVWRREIWLRYRKRGGEGRKRGEGGGGRGGRGGGGRGGRGGEEEGGEMQSTTHNLTANKSSVAEHKLEIALFLSFISSRRYSETAG